MIFTQTEGSVEQEVANQQAALARKPDALITTLVDNNAFLGNLKEAKEKGVIVIASNVDADRRTRAPISPGLRRPELRAGRHNARAADGGALPEGRSDPRTRRRQRAGPELVGAARQGHHERSRGIQEGEPGPPDRHRQTRRQRRRRDRHRSRRRLHQRASRHDRLYRDRPLAFERGPHAEGPRHPARKDPARWDSIWRRR